MNSDFYIGRPSTWHVMFYALAIMAIPVYFFYPRFHELSPGLKIVSAVLLVSSALGVLLIGIVMPMSANANRTTLSDDQRLMSILLAIISTTIGLWMLSSILHHQ